MEKFENILRSNLLPKYFGQVSTQTNERTSRYPKYILSTGVSAKAKALRLSRLIMTWSITNQSLGTLETQTFHASMYNRLI